MIRFKLVVHCFDNGVGDALRKSCDLLRITAGYRNGRLAVCEGYSVKLTVHLLAQQDREVECLRLLCRDRAFHLLADGELACLAGIGELYCCIQGIHRDGSSCIIYSILTDLDDCIKVICIHLSDRICRTCRYAGDHNTVIARHLDGRFAAGECITAECTIKQQVADFQFNGKLISLLFVRLNRADNLLAQFDLAGLAGVLNDCQSRLLRIDRSGLSGVGNLKVLVICFCYFIIQSVRQAGSVCGFAILQGEGRNTVFERHVAVRSGYISCLFAVLQGDSEVEVDILIRLKITFNRLVDDQAAFILRVGEGCDLLGCADRSGITGRGCHITVLVRFSLFYGVIDTDRQTLRNGFLAALQCDLSNTVCKVHITEGSGDRSIRQGYDKGKLIISAVGAVDGLHYFQIAGFVGVLKCYFCTICTDRSSFRYITRLSIHLRLKQIVNRLDYSVGDALRESFDRNAGTAFDLKLVRESIRKVKFGVSLVRILIAGAFSIIISGIIALISCLSTGLRVREVSGDLLIQHDPELKCLICFCRNWADHSLADRDLSIRFARVLERHNSLCFIGSFISSKNCLSFFTFCY